MTSQGTLVRQLERRFRVRAAPERVWEHLEHVERWPSWARHIRRVDLSPPGPLREDSEGTLRLQGGIRSTFRMEELSLGRNWKWAGPFLWLTVHYDHRFERIGPNETEVQFVLDGEGFGVRVFGWIFAKIYARNLDAAIPNLIAELEQHNESGSVAR